MSPGENPFFRINFRMATSFRPSPERNQVNHSGSDTSVGANSARSTPYRLRSRTSSWTSSDGFRTHAWAGRGTWYRHGPRFARSGFRAEPGLKFGLLDRADCRGHGWRWLRLMVVGRLDNTCIARRVFFAGSNLCFIVVALPTQSAQ